MIVNIKTSSAKRPTLLLSVVPVLFLLLFLGGVVLILGAGAISDYSCVALLSAAVLAVVLSAASGSLCRRGMTVGMRRSAAQILPAVPMLVCIGMVSATWMLSGVVPLLIDLGLRWLNAELFLVICCAVCGVISVLTGSSWTTIATIGVAFMGVGTVLGFHPGWIAGAIISGAYFGDKVSPLSDTTVVASSACGVDLFKHIRYLMISSIPSMTIALAVFLAVGLLGGGAPVATSSEIPALLAEHFNLSPWLLVIPALTVLMIVLRVPTLAVLAISALLGLVGMFVFQPELVASLGGDIAVGLRVLVSETSFDTGNELFDKLVATSGITGMLPTIALVLCAMLFGTAMIGTGMLGAITAAVTTRLNRRFSLVGSTVAGGLFLNSCTADQYLSIIIGGNMFRNAYRRFGLEPRLLSRTLEDSVSVTSVLIPWNSCGVTQSAVLGVATVVYMPYCIFNWLSPLMTLLLAYTGFKIHQGYRYVAARVEA